MAFKLDIFHLLSRLNSKSPDIYSTLTTDEKKGFSPLVVMRWMSGTSDRRQIMALNQYANRFTFPLAKHPHLQMQVLQACSSKAGGRNQWLGIKSSSRKPLIEEVVKCYFDYSSAEFRKLSVLPSKEDIIEMAEQLGWQADQIKKLKAEMKDA